MRKQAILSSMFILCIGLLATAQRSMRIGYIDMDYILENVPEYQEAQAQLNNKAEQWKIEIETKRSKIDQLMKTLENERILLTDELVAEREEEIAFLEEELFEYQQKRFGPRGDIMIQNRTLVEPIQDQVFNAVQDLAEARQYDFILDKSSDLVMLYANERHDVSDQVLLTINRASNRKQVNNRGDRKELERTEARTVEEEEAITERQEASRQQETEREQFISDRQSQRDSLRAAKERAFEEKRQRLLEDRQARRDSILAAREAIRNGVNPQRDEVARESEELIDAANADSPVTQERERVRQKQQARRDSLLASDGSLRSGNDPNVDDVAEESEDIIDDANPKSTTATPSAATRRREALKAREARRDSILEARGARRRGNEQLNTTNYTTDPTPSAAAQRQQILDAREARRDSNLNAREAELDNNDPNKTGELGNTIENTATEPTQQTPTAAEQRQQVLNERQARRDSIIAARQRIKDSILNARQRLRDSIRNNNTP